MQQMPRVMEHATDPEADGTENLLEPARIARSATYRCLCLMM
jgi:hypothetical protein